MKKVLSLTAALLLGLVSSASAKSIKPSLTCIGGEGDAQTTITSSVTNGVSVSFYLTSWHFPASKVVSTSDGEQHIEEAFLEEFTRVGELGEKFEDKNVRLRIKYVNTRSLGKVALLEELSVDGEPMTELEVLQCN